MAKLVLFGFIHELQCQQNNTDILKKKGDFYLPFYILIVMNRNSSLDDFINYLENRIMMGDFKNSVHKITFMTTLHVIKKIIGEK